MVTEETHKAYITDDANVNLPSYFSKSRMLAFSLQTCKSPLGKLTGLEADRSDLSNTMTELEASRAVLSDTMTGLEVERSVLSDTMTGLEARRSDLSDTTTDH